MTRSAPRTLPVRGPAQRLLHLRSPHFWITQALVLITVGAIYLTGSLQAGGTAGGLRVAAVALTALPVLYAARMFSSEAAALTALWVVALAGPTLVLGDPGTGQFAEPAVLVTALAVGTVLAMRVDAERGARERAEALSVRLTLLHDVLQVLARHEPIPVLLQQLADTIRRGMNADLVAIRYAPAQGTPVRVASGGDIGRTCHAAPEGDEECTVALSAEDAHCGEIAVVRRGRPYAAEERQVLAIAGLEVSAALELRLLEDHRSRALQMYARQVTTAQEAERTRIARDLHDGPVQLLAGLVRTADLIEKEREADGIAFGAAVERLRGMSEAALTELRSLTRDLRPMTLHRLGLHAALRSLAADVTDRSGVTVHLHVDGGDPLREEVELCIFRIVQEALTNVAKHAQATQVRAEVHRTPDEVRVEIRDNGRGASIPADPTELARHGRFGLLGMRERAALFNGTLEVASPVPGGEAGTSVILRLPRVAV